MTRSSRPPSKPFKFSGKCDRDLRAYALAAASAGVSTLALAQPAQGEIIYTPTNQTIGRNGHYEIDVNNDGIADFILMERARVGTLRFSTSQSVLLRTRQGNQLNCNYPYCLSTFAYAAALQQGSLISQSPKQHGWLRGDGEMAFERLHNNKTYTSNSWSKAANRYLGLKFQINGETHYGWARVSIEFRRGGPKERSFYAQLTGYAYETIPNKGIIAGKTQGTADDESPGPDSMNLGITESEESIARIVPGTLNFSSLGMLAQGAATVGFRRREDLANTPSK